MQYYLTRRMNFMQRIIQNGENKILNHLIEAIYNIQIFANNHRLFEWTIVIRSAESYRRGVQRVNLS